MYLKTPLYILTVHCRKEMLCFPHSVVTVATLATSSIVSEQLNQRLPGLLKLLLLHYGTEGFDYGGVLAVLTS